MPLSTVRGQFPYPVASDPDNVPGDIQGLADRLALLASLDMQGTLAARPVAVAENRGLYYFVTGDGTPANNDKLYRSTGAAWVEVLTGPAASVAYVAKTDAASARVATLESTTSTIFTDLATVGPAVTVDIGAAGRALVIVSTNSYGNTNGTTCSMAFAITGATTRAAAETEGALVNYSDTGGLTQMQASAAYLVTGLTPGSTTFTAKYASNGTGNFRRRQIVVIPL